MKSMLTLLWFTLLFVLFVAALGWLANESLVYFIYAILTWEALMISYRSTWVYLVNQELDLGTPGDLGALFIVSTLSIPFIPYLSFNELIDKD